MPIIFYPPHKPGKDVNPFFAVSTSPHHHDGYGVLLTPPYKATMQITQIKINNFKALQGEHIINTGNSIISLVGENNTGKTTLFAAIDFLKNGIAKDKDINDYKNKNHQENDVSVEITIQGNIKHIIENFSESKFLSYVYVENGNETIRLKRSSEKILITQKSKPVQLDETKITVFNQDTNQFENPAGIDRAIGTFFDVQFIWSDMQFGDVVDFTSTKIFGRLLKEISSEFKGSSEWRDFLVAHEIAFRTGDNALSKKSETVIQDIQKSLADFYGAATLQLDFQSPDPESFVKLGVLHVDDGVKTPLVDKGSGMQRALALSVVKVYSEFLSKHQENNELKKPIFFFIDEPEISLHPKAQDILAKALNEISKHQQIFITTHSPYFLRGFISPNNTFQIFSKINNAILIKSAEKMNSFEYSPTLSEIIYFAYNLPTYDFHNEIYGYISMKTGNFNNKDFDNWLNNHCQVQKDMKWIRITKDNSQATDDVSLMTYIRNQTHHPENTLNRKTTHEELEQSIKKMLSIIQSQIINNQP